MLQYSSKSRFLLPLLLPLALFGCGGSSDDSSGSSTLDTLTLSESNQSEVSNDFSNTSSGLKTSSESISDVNGTSGDSNLLIARVKSILDRYHPTSHSEKSIWAKNSISLDTPLTLPCEVSGSITAAFSANGQSTITFDNCQNSDGTLASGSLTASLLTNPNLISGRCTDSDLYYQINFNNLSVSQTDKRVDQASINGSMETCTNLTVGQSTETVIGIETLQMTLDANTVILNNYITSTRLSSESETLSSLYAAGSSYQYTVQGAIQSSNLNGRYNVSTVQPLMGILENSDSVVIAGPPSSGHIRFSGANDSRINIVVNAYDSITIEIDRNGDGEAEFISEPTSWSELQWTDLL